MKVIPTFFNYLHNYLSFESIVLGSTNFIQWLKELSPSNKYYNDLLVILHRLQSNQPFMYDLQTKYKTDLSKRGTRLLEHFFADMLKNATDGTKLYITKGSLSQCWRNTCCFSIYEYCSLSSQLQDVCKCYEAFISSYVKDILKGVTLC